MPPCAAWSEIVAKLAVPKSWEVDASAHSLHESVAAIYSDYKDKVEKPGASELPTELVTLKEVADASGKVCVRTEGSARRPAVVGEPTLSQGSGGEEWLPEV